MATTTPNFGWSVPTSTDLVKDGATAIETLGDSIDASLVDLKGGTTGQVLSKASNTDMDFSWVAQDDSNAIQNAIVDAKGDLIAATAADTPARLAVGTNGQVLTADSTAATGLKWATPASSAAGLTLVVAQTIGTSVSSVTVTNAFSTTYDDYLVIVSGGTATGSGTLTLKLGAATTGYYETQIYATYTSSTVSNYSQSNTSAFSFGRVSTAALNGYGIVSSPYLTKRTVLWGTSSATVTGDSSGTTTGMLDNATSYTDLVIGSGSSMTGGTIRVYGYQKS
jgi:hypothetical protein